MTQLPHVIHATSTVADGNMSFSFGEHASVVANRERFLARNGCALADSVVMRVEHGDRTALVGSSEKGAGTESLETAITADAMITATPGLTLCLLTADCLPISLYDPVHKAIGLIHCGWQSTDMHLPHKVLDCMQQTFHTNPADMYATIGPGIHKESYVRQNPHQRATPAWQPYLVDTPAGTQIDIVGYNRDALRGTGIPAEHLFMSSIDTARSPDYFSHDRAKAGNEAPGRFLTMLGLPA